MKVECYNSLYQLLKVFLLGWYGKGITVLYVLIFVLASYICILGYLLKPLPNKASLLVLLFLSLEMLPLHFLPLLGLLKALKYLPLMALTMLWPKILLPI